MVDVAAKAATHRVAVAARAHRDATRYLALIQSGSVKKGDVLGIARIAGIQAAKKTSDLIPLCHPLALTRVAVDFELRPRGRRARRGLHRHRRNRRPDRRGDGGPDRRQVALLTIYDMCKAVDRGMTITDVRLLEKHGGKSGSYRADRRD